MQETWTLSLPTTGKLTPEVIKQVLIDNKKDLGIFLSYYFKKEGALSENVSLNSEVSFEDQNSGSFTLAFDLVHFNACLAIHEQKRDQMNINFKIEGNGLTLTGPYWPERGMDEI
ncbi:hypothetical protein [Algoriphagus sp. NG3]|uniref:hypothetical protein n=1 Tax=unclassified Algoriphagus TaxID=2641541 RepID=UPI002A827A6C|nr:hypothetical protein [Algoriphagus sp. NG3]WPR77049.1 hypothetical protein SLW71_06805 [Algoriphagus sp. NG3]